MAGGGTGASERKHHSACPPPPRTTHPLTLHVRPPRHPVRVVPEAHAVAHNAVLAKPAGVDKFKVGQPDVVAAAQGGGAGGGGGDKLKVRGPSAVAAARSARGRAQARTAPQPPPREPHSSLYIHQYSPGRAWRPRVQRGAREIAAVGRGGRGGGGGQHRWPRARVCPCQHDPQHHLKLVLGIINVCGCVHPRGRGGGGPRSGSAPARRALYRAPRPGAPAPKLPLRLHWHPLIMRSMMAVTKTVVLPGRGS